MFYEENGNLIFSFDNETVTVEAWGTNALRVRSTKNPEYTEHDWALLPKPDAKPVIEIDEEKTQAGTWSDSNLLENNAHASMTNGKIKAVFDWKGCLTFYNQNGKILLKERWARLKDTPALSLNRDGREFKSVGGSNYRIAARFLADDLEKLFGMGQYQMKYLDMKGCTLELAHRNSQASVPFVISNLGYGFLWNNPAIGKCTFGKNETEWSAESSKQLDYWICAGDTPAEIEETYMTAVGKAPMMPDYGMGYWQCKLRYRTQDELLAVARKHKKLGLPMDVIVADFFHWTQQGEYKFDPKYWPDVKGMCDELNSMGIKLMVSIWPTVDYRSENFQEMMEKGMLVRTERGARITMQFLGQEVFMDPTNPKTREFVWSKSKKNYWDNGVRLFWLDEAEPEYTVYDYDNYRYYLGSDQEVGNVYPVMYAKTFFDGMQKAGMENPMNLLRCAWAGSAKYGTLVWSGDIGSTWETFGRQIRAGLSMAIAGIPWWTTDIGGFHGADIHDPKFHQLLVRWFEYGCFCPVFRLHGFRNPQVDMNRMDMISGVGSLGSGAENEVWSYGEDVFNIMKKYLQLRERMRPYITSVMQNTHEKGDPVMRPLFYEFSNDAKAWDVDDEYMFGSDVLVAPIYKDENSREVYLPAGAKWNYGWDNKEYEGGQTITVHAPIDEIPVFLKNGANIPIKG